MMCKDATIHVKLPVRLSHKYFYKDHDAVVPNCMTDYCSTHPSQHILMQVTKNTHATQNKKNKIDLSFCSCLFFLFSCFLYVLVIYNKLFAINHDLCQSFPVFQFLCAMKFGSFVLFRISSVKANNSSQVLGQNH